MDALLLLFAVLVCTLIYFIYKGRPDTKTEEDDVPPGRRLRIVLLGKTGSGKSSLANTLLQCGKFKVGRGLLSETRFCRYQIGTSYGTPVEIVDTPGLCDTHLHQHEIHREVAKSLAYAAPGPHVVLIVLRADRRFTKEEFQAYCTLKTIFGDELCSRMIIVFTGLDQLERDTGRRRQMQFLSEQIGEMTGNITTVLKEVNNRYTGINNTLTSYDDRRIQAMELFHKIKVLVASFGGMESFFTSPLVRRVNGFKMTWIHNYMIRHTCTDDEAEKAFIEMVPDDRGFLELMADLRVRDLCLVM